MPKILIELDTDTQCVVPTYHPRYRIEYWTGGYWAPLGSDDFLVPPQPEHVRAEPVDAQPVALKRYTQQIVRALGMKPPWIAKMNPDPKGIWVSYLDYLDVAAAPIAQADAREQGRQEGLEQAANVCLDERWDERSPDRYMREEVLEPMAAAIRALIEKEQSK